MLRFHYVQNTDHNFYIFRKSGVSFTKLWDASYNQLTHRRSHELILITNFYTALGCVARANIFVKDPLVSLISTYELLIHQFRTMTKTKLWAYCNDSLSVTHAGQKKKEETDYQKTIFIHVLCYYSKKFLLYYHKQSLFPPIDFDYNLVGQHIQ